MSLTSLDTLHRIRGFEVERVIETLPARGAQCHLLEIGAGSGFQAEMFARGGFQVKAIDVKHWYMGEDQGFPVELYDGKSIPYPDGFFDVVFSSNVLEHIPHLEDFQKEIHRVLKLEGIAVHVLPSGSWRVWTILFHYLYVPGLILRKIVRIAHPPPSVASSAAPNHTTPTEASAVAPGKAKQLLSLLFPSRHGERGTFLSEVYYFSRFYWSPFFKKTGWRILHRGNSGIFYEGYMILPRFFSLDTLKLLAMLLGSSTHIYLLSSLDNPADS